MTLHNGLQLLTGWKCRATAAVCFAVCLLALLSVASAQAQIAYSEEKLGAFVSAAIEVRALADKWAPAIQSAGSEAEAQAFKDQATSEMAEIITRTEGITVPEYMEINKAAAGSSDLMARIEQIYEARKAQ